MLLADSLIVLGLATVSLGSIRESDGVRQQTFVLRNEGRQPTALRQGYTSCGCTTIHFPKDKVMQPGDTAHVTLRFNPRNKGGEFYESGTVEYGQRRRRLTVAMRGECVTSEETLLRQFPVAVSDRVRLSTNRFDLGRMRRGETKERRVAVLYRGDHDRRETLTIRYTADPKAQGLQHVAYPVRLRDGARTLTATVVLDVFIIH